MSQLSLKLSEKVIDCKPLALGPNELRAAVAALQQAAELTDGGGEGAAAGGNGGGGNGGGGRGGRGGGDGSTEAAVAAMDLPVPDTFGVLVLSSALLHAWGTPVSLLARVDPRWGCTR
jgi:hypothetical protein